MVFIKKLCIYRQANEVSQIFIKIKAVLKEGNEYSLTRLMAVISFTVFLLGSLYLLIKGTTWGNYETFATFTGGGGAVTQIANKFINGKYNTPANEAGKPINNKEV